MRYLLLLAGLFSFSAFSHEYDFSGVDCNNTDTRKEIINAYNDILKDNDSGVSVVDTYNQKTISASKTGLVCYGVYEFSDGDKEAVTYKIYINSLGQPVNSFEPDNN